MNKRRLLKLADLLEADAKNKKGIKFNLGVLGEVRESGKPMSCGTQACAMGLAAISGAFRRAGLSYKLDNDSDAYIGTTISTTINGRRMDYDRAAVKIFEITMSEADFLFAPGAYWDEGLGTPQEAAGERFVAKRIRDFVAGKVGPAT